MSHYYDARRQLVMADDPENVPGEQGPHLTTAQVYATLAVAEQLHIANLLALLRTPGMSVENTVAAAEKAERLLGLHWGGDEGQ